MRDNLVDRLKIKLLNSNLMQVKIVNWIISFFCLIFNIIASVFGFNPFFTGLTRVIYRVHYYYQLGEKEIRISPEGIISNEKVLQKFRYSFLKFIAEEGIIIKCDNPKVMKKSFFKELIQKNSNISRTYHRVTGVLILNVLVLCGLNLYIFYRIGIFLLEAQFLNAFSQLLIAVVTCYFSSNTIIFYMGWRRYLFGQFTFVEASIREEYELKCNKNQPLVVTMLPSYKEDVQLVKYSLHSACLQNYGNNQVYVLLGNEYDSKEEEVKKNTYEVNKLVEDFNAELTDLHKKVNNKSKAFLNVKNFTNNNISNELLILREVCLEIANWFDNKINNFTKDEAKFSTNRYFIENNLKYNQDYFLQKADKCLEKRNTLYNSGELKTNYIKFLDESYIECKNIYSAKVEVFMRTKYANLEQEKTKAGNLTAFASLLGESWSEVIDETGQLVLKPDVNGKLYPKPDYLALFDIDAVSKANYLVRKVAYMEKHRDENVGLIQSPYRINYPEFTNAASASGLATTWFLPQYVLYKENNAAYWQGFNGVISYDAYASVGSFLAESMTEDTEFSLKLRANGYKVESSHEYQSQTLSPEDLPTIYKQRVRWASGSLSIAKQLFTMQRQKKIKFNNFFEVLCNYYYILGLNKLAVGIVILWLINSPLSYERVSLEMIPFFAYISAYFLYYPHVAKFKLATLIDGLGMNLFLQISYLEGFYHSIRKFVFNKNTVTFKTTSRKKNSKKRLNKFCISMMIFLFVWNGIQAYYVIQSRDFIKFFPFFQLICLALIVFRFILTNKRDMSDVYKDVNIEEKRYAENYNKESRVFESIEC